MVNVRQPAHHAFMRHLLDRVEVQVGEPRMLAPRRVSALCIQAHRSPDVEVEVVHVTP